MSQALEKGQSTPLLVTPKGKQRVQVGISWDVGTHRVTTGKWIFKKTETEKFEFDLDLLCCIYDKDGNYLEEVTPENVKLMDSSEQVYHIGDNQAGRTAGDDEYISLNIATMPENYESIVFVATSQKGKKFHEVANPEARVADGASDETQFHVALGKGPEAQSNLFVFCKISRDAEAESGWKITNISEYSNINDYQSWDEACKPHA